MLIMISQKQERYWHIVCPMFMCLAANVIAVATLNTVARCKSSPAVENTTTPLTTTSTDVAMMLMPASFYGAAIVVLSWITASLSQPSVKRASAIALINAITNTPNGTSNTSLYSRFTIIMLIREFSMVLVSIRRPAPVLSCLCSESGCIGHGYCCGHGNQGLS